MAWSFNPFTGNLDLVGGGAVVFEGEVETFADLPETVGDPAVGASFLVRSSTGVWLVNRRQAGIWIRRNNTGVRATDWEYGGDYPVNSVAGKTGNVTLTNSDISGLGSAATANLNAISDADFRLIGSTDATKKVAIEVDSLVSAGTTRTLTVPNGDATIAATPASRLQQFFSSQTYNVAEGLNVELQLQNSIPSCAIVVVLPRLTTDGARNGDEILISPLSLASGSSYTLQRYTWTGSSYAGSTETITTMEAGQTYRLRLVGGVWTLLVTPNLASPPAIGSTTRNTGAFTTLNATNGTITASAPVLDLAQTWNNAAVTFTGFRANITDTASAAASVLASLQTGGTRQLAVTKTGDIQFKDNTSGGLTTNPVIFDFGNNQYWCHLRFAGTDRFTFQQNDVFTIRGGQLQIGTNFVRRESGKGLLEFNTGTTATEDGIVLSGQTTFASSNVAIRNGTNAQTFRLYNTTDAGLTNFERGFMRWSSNVLQIGTEAGGTGSNRSLEIRQNVSSNWGFSIFRDTTRILGSFDNDIFCDSATTFGWSSRLRLTAPADGRLLMRDNAATGFDRLQFGGTTSSFPAIKRSSTALQVRLADDSAFAPLECGNITVNGTTNGTVGSAVGLLLSAASTNNITFQTNGTARWIIGGSSGALQGSDGVPIRLGGSTSSFPLLKNSGAIVQARLADDTGYTTIDANHRLQGTAPATSGATGTAGDIRYDADYIYVCTAANTWKRAAIATW